MVAYIHDRVFDNGLTVLDTEANELWICSGTTPFTTYAAANTAKLGTKALAAGGIGAPAAGTPDGRAVTIAAFSDGTVATSGTAGTYAIVDTANSRVLVSQTLAATQGVTAGNTFSLPAFTTRIPAPTT
jgi:hypothetical protein